MQTLKFKPQPTNAFFATVNQMFGGSSQLPTTAERAVIKSNRRVQLVKEVLLCVYLKENKTDSLTCNARLFLSLIVAREKQNDRNGRDSFPGSFCLPRWRPCQIPDPRAAPKCQNPDPGKRSPSQFAPPLGLNIDRWV